MEVLISWWKLEIILPHIYKAHLLNVIYTLEESPHPPHSLNDFNAIVMAFGTIKKGQLF